MEKKVDHPHTDTFQGTIRKIELALEQLARIEQEAKLHRLGLIIRETK